jgi:hypothetical protein
VPIESPSCLLAKMGYPKNNQYGLDGCHFSLARDDQRGRRGARCGRRYFQYSKEMTTPITPTIKAEIAANKVR